MRACANGKKEIATILYHWNSAAAKLRGGAGLTAAQLARMSSCPELGEELDTLERQRRQEQIGPAPAAPRTECPQQHGAAGAAAAEPVIFAVPAKQRQTHRISSRDAAALVRNGSLDRQWR